MKLMSLIVFSLWFSPAFSLEADDEKVIAMASEGAPDNVTANATIMKFREGKFHTIREGENNFTCMVISDPQGRYEPSCFNEEAMRSVFPTYQFQMKHLYQGKLHAEVDKLIEHEFNEGNLPTAEHGALVYMMSPNNLGFNPATNQVEATPVHQMYYFPKLADETFSLSSEGVFLWQGYPHLSALIVMINSEEAPHQHY